MAWYAECKRRKSIHCINAFDMVAWYNQKLYDDWWNSLTKEEQLKVIAERERRRKEGVQKAMTSLVMMNAFMGYMFNEYPRETEYLKEYVGW